MKITLWLTGAALLAESMTASVGGAQDRPKPDAPAAQAPDKPAGKDAIAPDINPAALWDGREIVPFKAMDFPKMVRAADADFMENDEYVLGLTINGESRAYPTRFISWHHVINDRVGKPEFGGEAFVTVTYWIVCNTGVRFDPVVKNRPLMFDFHGLYNGVVTMFDRDTQSVWFQVGGRAIKGPLVGTELKSGPLLDTTWAKWKQLHPDTLVMSPDTPYKSHYPPKGRRTMRGSPGGFPASYFTESITRGDRRLPAFDMVLAVALPSTKPAQDETARNLYRAYPVKTLKESPGVLNDTLGTVPVGIFYDAEANTATAVSRTLDGKTLTLETRKGENDKVAFYDKETGTRWSIEGVGEEGPLAGKALTRLNSHMSEWYGWVSYFPDTSIYGRDDPPQPIERTPTAGLPKPAETPADRTDKPAEKSENKSDSGGK